MERGRFQAIPRVLLGTGLRVRRARSSPVRAFVLLSARRGIALLAALAFMSCSRATRPGGPGGLPGPGAMAYGLVPVPVSAQITPTDSFVFDSTTVIVIDAAASADVDRVGRFLAELIA